MSETMTQCHSLCRCTCGDYYEVHVFTGLAAEFEPEEHDVDCAHRCKLLETEEDRMTEIKIDEAAAVEWMLRPFPDVTQTQNAARAAMRWREEKDAALDILNGTNDDAPDTLAVYLYRNWTTPDRERLKRRLMLPSEMEARAREIARNKRLWGDIDALKADQTDWRNGVGFIAAALGKSTLSCVDLAEAALEVRANLEQAQARIAELEAERDAALKRAEAAEAKLSRFPEGFPTDYPVNSMCRMNNHPMVLFYSENFEPCPVCGSVNPEARHE